MEGLRARLLDADDSVRLNAAIDLAEAGDAAAVPVLVEMLAHDRAVVRRRFVRPALVQVGARAARDLESAASAGDPLVALGAAAALAAIDSSRRAELLRALRRALEAGGPARDDALQTLWDDPDAAALVREDLLRVDDGDGGWQTDARSLALLLLARVAPRWSPAQRSFLAARSSDVAAVRRGGALALGHAGQGPGNAVGRLEATVLDEVEQVPVRMAAAYALARVGDPDIHSVPALRRLLAGAVPGLRVTAVRILGETGAGGQLYEPSGNLYRWLVSAHPLRGIPPERVVGPLTEALDDDDRNVRRNAVLALSWLTTAGRKAAPSLERMLDQPYLGPLASEALSRIDGRRLEREVELDDLYLQVRGDPTGEKAKAFEQLFDQAAADAAGAELRYTLPFPKHEFLRHLCDTRGVMLHGSERGDLDMLKPLRDSTDAAAWGNVSGVYGEPDPIRPIYFAIIDRTRSFGLLNTCFTMAADGSIDTRLDDARRPRHYRLSVGFPAVGAEIWRDGWIYVLPADTFEFWEEWTSRVPVQPIFRLAVSRMDLPLALSYADLRKPGSPWVAPDAELPYLDDVWSTPVKPLP